MKETERELWEALMELVCCPAFNGQVFERDRESHRAWTLAREVLERHRPLPTEKRERRGIRLDELPTGGQGQVLYPDTESRRNMIKPAEGDDIPAFLKRQAE